MTFSIISLIRSGFITECQHVFHKECLAKWWSISTSPSKVQENVQNDRRVRTAKGSTQTLEYQKHKQESQCNAIENRIKVVVFSCLITIKSNTKRKIV